MPNNERSAEWCRGAVAVLGRMVDECSTVFDSDLPHITQGNLEDYLAEYAQLLAAAEAREAGENAAEISADRAWIDGAKFGWNCETKTDLHEAIANRQQQIREATPAPEVIHGVRESLDALGIRPDSLSETVEKLREACSGVRVEPEPEKLPAADEVRKALEKAHWIGCSPHEWPTVDDIPLLCHALIAEHSRASTAAEVIEACEKALHHERQGLQNLIDFRGFWFGGERRYGALTMEELTEAMVRMEAVSALCGRWKAANGG